MFGRLGRRGGGAEGDAVFGPVFIESRDDLVESVAARGPRVKRGAGDPDATSGVEGDVERFLDSRLGGDELDFETGREVEERLGLRGRKQRGVGRIAAGIGGAEVREGRQTERQ